MQELWAVIVKEFLQLRMDKKMIPAMVVGPVIQLLALGYAANLDVTHVPMVLVAEDRSPASRALVERFTGAGTFDLVGAEDTPAAIDLWLVEGRAQIALVIASGYGEDHCWVEAFTHVVDVNSRTPFPPLVPATRPLLVIRFPPIRPGRVTRL